MEIFKPDRNMPLTAERLRHLMHYDPQTGIFTNRITRGARAQKGGVSGSPDKDGYLQAKIDLKTCKLHRLAFLYVTGEWPECLVDHRDGVKSNNVWRNLRHATVSLNTQNMRHARSDSQTGLLGSSYDTKSGKYLAQILIDGKKKNLGRFDTAEQAHEAYVKAKRIHHKGNTL